MNVVSFDSFRRNTTVYTFVAALALLARPAFAQYNATMLPPPADLPTTTLTRAFAMNNSGQVFGEVLVTAADRRPVLWTGAVPSPLAVPAGYLWDDLPGQQFVNDGGTVVAKVYLSQASGLAQSRVITWQNGVANILDPALLQTSCSYGQYYPVGLNNAGDILVVGANRTDNGHLDCENMWIWHHGVSADALPFRDAAGIPGVCELPYSAYLIGNHLNDADHASLQRTRIAFNASSNCNPFPEVPGVLAGGVFSPISATAFATQINNHDQVLLLFPNVNNGSPRWGFWDGAAIVDLGVYLGVASVNDAGAVVFTDRSGPQIYRNGIFTPLVLPQLPSMVPGAGAFLINSTGQLVGNAFFEFNGPFGGPAVERAILFTPIAPTITWSAPSDIVYGTPLTSTQLNATASVPGAFVYAPPAGTVLGAGARTLSLTFTPADPAYTTATTSVTINVGRAGLTIAASDASKVFGAPLPAFNTSSVGFVNNDGPASLTGTLVATTTATPTSPVGQYAITPSGVSSANYAINFVDGTLAVTKANTTLGLTSSAPASVAAQNVTFTATAAAVAPGAGTPSGAVTFLDGATVLGTVALSNGAATLTTNALALGGHSIAAQYGGDSNFTASGRTITQTVAAASVQLTATAKFVRNGIGQYIATITVKNAGNIAANGAQLGVSLNTTGSVDGVTQLGNLGPGSSVTVFATFPAGAGVSGSANNALRMQINWLTGNASLSQRVALP